MTKKYYDKYYNLIHTKDTLLFDNGNRYKVIHKGEKKLLDKLCINIPILPLDKIAIDNVLFSATIINNQ